MIQFDGHTAMVVPTKNSIHLTLQRLAPFEKTGALGQLARFVQSGEFRIWEFCICPGEIGRPFGAAASLRYHG